MGCADNFSELLENDFNIKWNSLCAAAQWAKNIQHDNPEIFVSLKRVFVCSDFVAKNCIHNPDLLDRLIKTRDIEKKYQPDEYNNKLEKALLSLSENNQDKTRNLITSIQHILRRFRLYEMIRIAWRDLAGWAGIEETMTDLSAIADACVNLSLEHLHNWQCSQYGIPAGPDGSQQYLVVIAMGKLGAGELNFSSDIDLIFAYPEHGKTKGKENSISNEEFFVRLCRHLCKVISEVTDEGFVFRVDTRLRPYGESGPLVMSFDNMESYYQRQGREWERYAWIKARLTGDENGPGKDLIKMLQPFVYRKYLDFGIFESLRKMKNKISLEVQNKGMLDNVKLGRGGIREIEFFAQIFQLIRGGVTPVLREPRIYKALNALFQNNYIEENTFHELINAYGFLRNTEHRLQEFSDQQTQNLPVDILGKERLAFSMGFTNWESFASDLRGHMEKAHYHFNTLLSEKKIDGGIKNDRQETKKEIELKALWQDLRDNKKNTDILSASGFDKPEEILRLLDNLQNDVHTRKLSLKGRKRLDRLIPNLMIEAGRCGLSVSIFNRIIELIKAIESRSCYIALLLENPTALAHMIKLANVSPWIISFLSRHPVLLDELLDPRILYVPPERKELEAEIAKRFETISSDDLESQIQELCIFKQFNILRVAAADITGAVKLMRTSDHLTEIAEVIVNKVVELSWDSLTEKHGIPKCIINGAEIDRGFAVIAYGKLGGIELGYGSDLDLVFLHAGTREKTRGSARPVDNSQFFTRLGQKIVHILTSHTTAGMLYKIDMRLRPSGNAGPLVSHVDSFRNYELKKAWTWEHQAIVRARPISGSIELSNQFKEIREEALSKKRNKSDLQKQIIDMRELMLKELPKPEKGMFDLVYDRGGIVDIEFLVQYMVLLNTHGKKEVAEWTDNIRILETLTRTKIIDKGIALDLKEAFLLYRAAVHRLRLQEKPTIVPEERFYTLRKRVENIWKDFLEL